MFGILQTGKTLHSIELLSCQNTFDEALKHTFFKGNLVKKNMKKKPHRISLGSMLISVKALHLSGNEYCRTVCRPATGVNIFFCIKLKSDYGVN